MIYQNSYASFDTRLYHKQPPTPLSDPQAGHFNPIVANQIGWDKDKILMDKWVEIISGQLVPQGFEPLAMVYAGHQFGHWAGQLGDGRGLLMAQVIDINGILTDLHLKGIGLTPYSRMGDGRAVLRSTIREYLCGHAMSCLNIPSTNALGFVTSNTPVQRETTEQGAALMRVADTHIRLGHVEWIASFAPDLLADFTKYMITTYYPQLLTSSTPIADFMTAVAKRTAKMIANWQLVGFAHGVMNTDNLSITGSTIDYGPFAFLERFDPAWINNHSDYTGRYTYQNQPSIGYWNLNVWMMHFMQLSNIKVFNGKHEVINRNTIQHCLNAYENQFSKCFKQGIINKVGLPVIPTATLLETDNNQHSSDQIKAHEKTANQSQINEIEKLNNKTFKLAMEFLDIVEQNKLDYTNSFRSLIAVAETINSKDGYEFSINQNHEFQLLDTINQELATQNNEKSLKKWQQWQDEYLSHINNYLNLISSTRFNVCAEDLNSNKNSAKLDDIDDCFTNTPLPSSLKKVINTLKSNNPAYVLRNAMAQKAIELAEAGDFTEIDRLFKLLTSPFEVQTIAVKDDVKPPDKGCSPMALSCSS